MFQDMLPGCTGLFSLRQLQLGIRGDIIPNDRGIVKAFQIGDTPIETGTPLNIPCTGTSQNFKDYTGECNLLVYVHFLEDKRSEYVALIEAISNWNEQSNKYTISDDEDEFTRIFKEADQPIVPDSMVFTS